MPSLVTDAIKESINCCTVTSAGSLASKSQQGSLTPACIYETLIQAQQNDILQKYIKTGELLEEGFISTATLDISAFASFAVPVTLVVFINGVQVASQPEAIYGTVDLFGAALVTAIANGGSGYTSSYSAVSQSITINSPNSGSASNGFVVSIVINPEFKLDETITFDTVTWRQSIHIEDTASGLDEYIVLAAITPTQNTLWFISNRVHVNTVVTWPPAAGGQSGSWSVAYRPDDNTVWTGAFLNTNATVVNDTPAADYLYVWSGVSAWAVYNATNNSIYSADSFFNFLRVVDSANVLTSIATPITPYVSNPMGCIMAVDETTGNVWTIGVNGIFAFTTGGVAAFAPILTPGEQARSITYDDTPGSECMYVGYQAPLACVVKYNLNGTVASSPFYTDATAVSAVLFSRVHKYLFAKTTLGLKVVRQDGTEKQDLGLIDSFVMMEDVTNGEIITTNYTVSTGSLNYFVMGNTGEQEFSGALEGGTPNVYMEEADQCHSEASINSMVQKLTSECGCVDCGTATVTSFSPRLATYTIYYGNSASSALNAAGVEALGTVASQTYAGNYTFGATAPSEYKYIAYPALLGTPTRFYDPSTGLDIPMSAVYQVTINSIIYNVYRSYWEIGGAGVITVSS